MEVAQHADSGHLEPFDHKVAGQSLVFRYDASTICKSLIPREHDVYRALPPLLRPYVPQYRGVVDIPLKDHLGADGHRHPDLDPGLQAAQRHLAKVAKSEEQEHVYHFILLENLVARFRHPCLLDLKLGTRQHGDDAPPEKVEYQVNKCRNTTSSTLGVRLCGMKVYQVTSDQYLEATKAEGRDMCEQDFRRAVAQFLHNGHNTRRDVILAILERLQQMKRVIGQLETFRFYSSSLLIVYDGQVTDNEFHVSHHARKTSHMPSNHTAKDDGNVTPTDVTGNHMTAKEDNHVITSHMSPGDNMTPKQSNHINSTQDQSRRIKVKPQVVDLVMHACARPCSNHSLKNGDTVTADKDDLCVFDQNAHVLVTEKDETHVSDQNVPQNINATEAHGSEKMTATRRDDRIDTDETKNDDTHDHTNGADHTGQGVLKVRADHDVKNVLDTQSDRDRQNNLDMQNNLDIDVPDRDCPVDVRLVDFAHTTFAGFGHDTVRHEGVDKGCLKGLQTLIDILTDILHSR